MNLLCVGLDFMREGMVVLGKVCVFHASMFSTCSADA